MKFWKKGKLSKSDEKSLSALFKAIPNGCAKETSSDSVNWRKDNPLYGHCVMVAISICKVFGGEILRAPLSKVKGYEQMRSHYWNRLPNGAEVDLTSNQFKGDDRNLVPPGKSTKRDRLTGRDLPITVEGLLACESTRRRHQVFKINMIASILSLGLKMKRRVSGNV